MPFLMRIFRVCAFLPDVIQQIHSLRASVVMSSHTARAAGAEIRAFRKSSGIVCTTPPASFFPVITVILSNPLRRRGFNEPELLFAAPFLYLRLPHQSCATVFRCFRIKEFLNAF